MEAPLLLVALALATPVAAAEPGPELRFAWPSRASAKIELTDERRVGETYRSNVVTMRMTVAPDGASDRLLLRFSERSLVSSRQRTSGTEDPTAAVVSIARILAHETPSFVVSPDGDFFETRDLDASVREVVGAAGLPGIPTGTMAFFHGLLTDVAAEDWNAWVGAWRGPLLQPGETTSRDAEIAFHGAPARVALTRRGLPPSDGSGRIRLQATLTYPSDAVRSYTSGVLLDLAVDAHEAGDDPEFNARFLERATFSPMIETLTVELEPDTMLPVVVERVRAFSAAAGRQRVEGEERRVHRFTWDTGTP